MNCFIFLIFLVIFKSFTTAFDGLTRVVWNNPQMSNDTIFVNQTAIDLIFLDPQIVGRKIFAVSVNDPLEDKSLILAGFIWAYFNANVS